MAACSYHFRLEIFCTFTVLMLDRRWQCTAHLQAVHHAPSPGTPSALVLPAVQSTSHDTAAHSSTLPQLQSYSDSNTGAGAHSAAAVVPLAATHAVAGQLLPAVAVQGQQPQPQGAKLPAANGVTAAPIPQQQRRLTKEPALGADANKEAAYHALWQWVYDVSGWVSCEIYMLAAGAAGRRLPRRCVPGFVPTT